MNSVVAIIQARMTSTRLPGKVMAPICDKPMLWHVVNRLKGARLLDEIVVATSTEKEDDIIAAQCARWGVNIFRGSLDDVLDRYYGAAQKFKASVIVRVTADCPLIDPELVDRVVEKFLKGGYDLVGLNETFPDGVDTEVILFSALERAWTEARLASEREHVTPYIKKNEGLFKRTSVSSEKDLSHIRLSVDDPADLELIRKIYEGFGCRDEIFLTDDVVEFLEANPGLLAINAETLRNEGYLKSLKEDKTLASRVTKES